MKGRDRSLKTLKISCENQLFSKSKDRLLQYIILENSAFFVACSAHPPIDMPQQPVSSNGGLMQGDPSELLLAFVENYILV